ncbi:unnamed protein product [Closterium sp. NIES-53]
MCQAATDNFSAERKLGEGGFGTVYSGTLHHTPVAVKLLKSQDSIQAMAEFQQESRLMLVKLLKSQDSIQAMAEFQQEVSECVLPW